MVFYYRFHYLILSLVLVKFCAIEAQTTEISTEETSTSSFNNYSNNSLAYFTNEITTDLWNSSTDVSPTSYFGESGTTLPFNNYSNDSSANFTDGIATATWKSSTDDSTTSFFSESYTTVPLDNSSNDSSVYFTNEITTPLFNNSVNNSLHSTQELSTLSLNSSSEYSSTDEITTSIWNNSSDNSTTTSTGTSFIYTTTTTASIWTNSPSTSTLITNSFNSTENCPSGYYAMSPAGPCYFDFKYLSPNATIQSVTNEIDPLAQIDEITFKCSIKCPNGTDCSSLNGTVIWYGQGLEIERTDLKYNQAVKEIYGFLNETSWSLYMNQNISCQIIPEHNSSTPLFSIMSQPLHAGIECDMPNLSSKDKAASTKSYIQVSLEEGSTNSSRLRCKLNIPVLCKNRTITDCDLKIWINYKNKNGYNRVVTKECIPQSNGARSCDACNKSFKKQSLTNEDRTKEWDLNVNMETKNKNYQNEFYEIEIKTNNDSNLLKDLYKNLTLPLLNVKFMSKNRPLTVSANCFNDPHCSTFDGRWFELQRPGEFLMYDNSETQTRVHLRNKPCWPQWSNTYPYCLNNVYIQSMHEIINLDLENNLFYYSNLKTKKFDIPIIFENGVALNSFDQFIVSSSGYGIQVETGYGVTVQLYGWYYWWIEKFVYSWMQINPSKGDEGKITGLFGNFNGDYKDDFVSIRSSNLQNATENEIFESFKAGPLTKIPSFFNGERYAYNDLEIQEKFNYCDCLNTDPTITTTSSCSSSLNEKTFNKPKSKSKRSTSVYVDFDAIANSESMRIVKKFGIKFFEHSRKKRQVPNTNSTSADCNPESPVMNTTKLKELCEQDYVDVPVIPWGAGYDENTKSVSGDILNNDVNQFLTDSNGTKVPNVDLIKSTCPKNCSENGFCNDRGECVCNPGYSLVDCSVKLSDPPSIKGISTQSNIIDVSKVKFNDIILFMSRFVADYPDSKIKCSIFVKNSAKSFAEKQSIETKGFPLNMQATFFDLQNLTSSNQNEWYLLKISATNNGINYSDPISLMIYPSNSYKCNLDVENFNCEKIVTIGSSFDGLRGSSNKIFNMSWALLALFFALKLLKL